MDLHAEIMNIQIPNDFDYADFPSKVYAYKSGHRDARHVAAELALKAQVRIEELEESLEWILDRFKSVLGSKPVKDADEVICHVEKLLENRK